MQSISPDAMLFSGLCLGTVVLSISAFLFFRGGNDGGKHLDTDEAALNDDDVNDVEESGLVGGELLLCFGSQTGTAEGFANSLKAEGRRHGFATTLVDLEDFDAEQLKRAGKAIFLMATYGEGEPTDNALTFIKWLKDNEEPLNELSYTVFGLGNRQYEHYNAIGKLTDKEMTRHGAQRMYVFGEGDDDDDLDTDFENWKEGLWPALVAKFGGSGDGGANQAVEEEECEVPFTVRYLTADEVKTVTRTPESAAASSTRFYWEGVDAKIMVNDELRSPKDGGSTRHIEISLEGTNLSYETADNLAVMPENTKEGVEALADMMGYDLEAWFTMDYKESTKASFPTPCTVREALTRYVDFMCAPRRVLLKQLRPFVHDEKERTFLDSLLTTKGKQLKEESDGLSVLELLQTDFPSCRVPLGSLLHVFPRLHPRYYTISSSSSIAPTQPSITVALIAISYSSGRVFKGVCTHFLAGLVPGNTSTTTEYPICRIFIKPSTFRLPPATTTPIVMIGPGTGIAPMRALLLERKFQKENSQLIGTNVLFFGCRRSDEDFLYRDELELLQRQGTLQHLYLAFSREGKTKVYVQDRMREHGEALWKLLDQSGAHVYICGGTSMGTDVQKELVAIAKLHGSMSEGKAKDYVTSLHSQGRYCAELWS